MPLKEGSVISEDMFMAHSAGELMVTAPRLSSDRMKATLFLNGFLALNSRSPFPSLAINSMTFLVAKSMWMEMEPQVALYNGPSVPSPLNQVTKKPPFQVCLRLRQLKWGYSA